MKLKSVPLGFFFWLCLEGVLSRDELQYLYVALSSSLRAEVMSPTPSYFPFGFVELSSLRNPQLPDDEILSGN